MLTLFKNEEDLDNFAMTLYNCFTKGMPQSGQRIRKKKNVLKIWSKGACKQVPKWRGAKKKIGEWNKPSVASLGSLLAG